MVPKLIRVLDRMPINNNGKVDRQALSKRIDIPTAARIKSVKLPPRNDVERAVYEEFARVLGVEIGITDSFFDFGGHSLMATKVASRINKRLNANITVGDILRQP